MTKERLAAEELVYKTMDILDPSGANTDYWKDEFANMSDAQFVKYISQNFPFYYQTGAFAEPSMDQITKALKHIKAPLLERVYLPYKYKDAKGRPMKTKECLVLYIHMKRMKQLLTKKNGMSIDTSQRDMRTGLLTGTSKNGKESDHEFESLAISGLTATAKELSRARADAMGDKDVMNNTIKLNGYVSLKDLPEEKNDSVSKKTLYAYFMGAQLITSLVGDMDAYMTPYTMSTKKRKGVKRID